MDTLIEIVRGETKEFHLRIKKKSDGTPFDLTGLTGTAVKFQIAKEEGDPAVLSLDLSGGVELASAAGGLIKVTISSANSALLKVEDCQDFELTIVKAGKTYKKIIEEMITVEDSLF